jgi:hypothetical protein
MMQRLLALLLIWCLATPIVAEAALIASWPMQDNAATTVIVESVAANNMAAHANTSTLTQPGPGGSYTASLRGIDGDGWTTGSFDIGSPTLATMAVFFKTTGTEDIVIVYSLGGYNSGILFSGDFTALECAIGGVENTIASGLTALNDGAWHHVTVTFSDSANEVKGYIDGQLVGTVGSVSATFSSGGQTFNHHNFGLGDTVDYAGMNFYNSLEDPVALAAEGGIGGEEGPAVWPQIISSQ